MGLHACVCVCLCARVCSRMHECIYACIKHVAQSCLCPHCLCLCLSFHTHICVWIPCVCTCVWVCVYARCHLFVSGSGHIHVFISVPSGQIRLSCLLKRDSVPNSQPKKQLSVSAVQCTEPQPIGAVQNRKSNFFSAYIIAKVQCNKRCVNYDLQSVIMKCHSQNTCIKMNTFHELSKEKRSCNSNKMTDTYIDENHKCQKIMSAWKVCASDATRC